jgi:hypothetical protein
MIRYKTIYNFIEKNSEYENEDALVVKESNDFHLLSLSDGAGGAGIFCKDWALFLAEQQPVAPFCSDLQASEWFLKLSKLFYEKQIKKIDTSDDFVREKFYEDGSYATLLYCWVSKKENTLYYTGTGDTTLFIFSKNGKEFIPQVIYPINTQNKLNDSPKLLNWNKELKYSLLSNSASFKNGDIAIMCTDGLARRIIYQLYILDQQNTENLLGPSISASKDLDLLEFIRTGFDFKTVANFLRYWEKLIVKDRNQFKQELMKLIERNELEKDDYSIIFINL